MAIIGVIIKMNIKSFAPLEVSGTNSKPIIAGTSGAKKPFRKCHTLDVFPLSSTYQILRVVEVNIYLLLNNFIIYQGVLLVSKKYAKLSWCPRNFFLNRVKKPSQRTLTDMQV